MSTSSSACGNARTKSIAFKSSLYYLVWAIELSLAAIGLVFPALVLGYNVFKKNW
jgi:hypothetical protein